MISMFITLFIYLLFVYLFFRECRLDKKIAVEKELKGDLHILKEMKRFLHSKGVDTSSFDTAIADLTKQKA